jgi:hypothetical protein
MQLYQQLAYEIDLHGPKATENMVQEREVTAADILMRTADAPDCSWVKRMIKVYPGFDKDWTFGKHRGKGLVLMLRLDQSLKNSLSRI